MTLTESPMPKHVDERSIEAGTARRTRRRYAIVVVLGIALLVAVAALNAFHGRGPVIRVATDVSSGVPPIGQIPPRGEIWFGTDFDPGTFDVAGRTTTGTPGTNLAAVAHLRRSIGDGQGFWRLNLNDQLFQNGLRRLRGYGDLLGTTVPSIDQVGRYEYAVEDLSGNVLALGSFVVTAK